MGNVKAHGEDFPNIDQRRPEKKRNNEIDDVSQKRLMVGIDPGPTAHGFPNHDQLCNNEEPKKPFWTFGFEFKNPD